MLWMPPVRSEKRRWLLWVVQSLRPSACCSCWPLLGDSVGRPPLAQHALVLTTVILASVMAVTAISLAANSYLPESPGSSQISGGAK
jgi:hypothetical protein